MPETVTIALGRFVPDTFQDACQFGEKSARYMKYSFIYLFLKIKFYIASRAIMNCENSLPDYIIQ
uniref:Uncharacterized protein n=1 Tax=Rhizobium rhizogenes TaxID=359 RepID=A0A7S4ZU57_RHIRH|nr:hypothetical protein pC5.8b_429 [Rhizobium rhizogenes]